jgi:hypothetical protein
MKSNIFVHKTELNKMIELLEKYNLESCELIQEFSSSKGFTLKLDIRLPVMLNNHWHQASMSVNL